MFDKNKLVEVVTFSLRIIESLGRLAQKRDVGNLLKNTTACAAELRKALDGLQGAEAPSEVLKGLYGTTLLGTFDLLWRSVQGTIDASAMLLQDLVAAGTADPHHEVWQTCHDHSESLKARRDRIPDLQQTLCTGDVKIFDFRFIQLTLDHVSRDAHAGADALAASMRQIPPANKAEDRYQVYIQFGGAYQSTDQCIAIVLQLDAIQKELVRRGDLKD